ncbi:cadherin-23-like isoform X4 [Ruditapes philippinarum]|uniref:cadherin-23-like isoform X4 n=1 Tax=Ruditapes philippinarum TaxID=129788 RepID=UPI00295AF352|nr:cadherin-23-like isoform X4 [Ruditapes philippinarum]
MAKGVGTSAFICLIFLGLFLRSDADITSWTTPSITGDSGTGTLSVDEDQALDTTIKTYAAETDETVKTITYALVTAVAPFTLDSTGELKITQALDHETQDSYTLEIKATDNNDEVGIATITVTVGDVNEAPSFAKATSGKRISKDSATGTTIMTVTATDPDDGDVLKYSIHSGDTNNDFTIDEASGLIKTAKAISGTTTNAYSLVIHAVDDDTPKETGMTTVVVWVEDCSCSGAASVTAGLVLVLAGLLKFLY